MATEGKTGDVYLRARLDTAPLAEDAQSGKAIVRDFATAVTNDVGNAGKSIANLGGTASGLTGATANIERFKDAFGGIARATKEELGESARFTNSFVSQLRRSAADVDAVTQSIVNRAKTLQSADSRLQNPIVDQTIAGLQKLADQNAVVTAKIREQASAQAENVKRTNEAAAAFANFEKSANSAILSAATAGKSLSESLQIKADRAGLGGNAAAQKLIAEAKAIDDAIAASALNAQKKVDPAMKGLVEGTKAYNAALRQVPAQLTDIVVSLQGGQAPLTVLLQQGGQLRDVFGTAGGAAKALGRELLGLINPYTVAAAAVGTLILAYKTGSDETDEFRKALVLTGNQAGLTTNSLAGLAENISAVQGTTGAAAAALAQFAASGAVGAAGIQKATEAALALEKFGGQAVAETVKQFKALGDDPLKASLRLNDATNFLTTSLY
jgi:hypothetical protein